MYLIYHMPNTDCGRNKMDLSTFHCLKITEKVIKMSLQLQLRLCYM
jgi:hypothetical protein